MHDGPPITLKMSSGKRLVNIVSMLGRSCVHRRKAIIFIPHLATLTIKAAVTMTNAEYHLG
jgi:hypothetical protein